MRRNQPSGGRGRLTASLLSIFGELCLAVYLKAFDTYNVLGHLYKIAAFSLIYLGVYGVLVKAPYLRLVEAGERLQEEIDEKNAPRRPFARPTTPSRSGLRSGPRPWL